MNVTAQEAETLRARLADLFTVPTYDPATMVTARVMADEQGIAWTTARRKLENMVRAGTLQTLEVVMPDGKKSRAYVRT